MQTKKLVIFNRNMAKDVGATKPHTSVVTNKHEQTQHLHKQQQQTSTTQAASAYITHTSTYRNNTPATQAAKALQQHLEYQVQHTSTIPAATSFPAATAVTATARITITSKAKALRATAFTITTLTTDLNSSSTLQHRKYKHYSTSYTATAYAPMVSIVTKPSALAIIASLNP